MSLKTVLRPTNRKVRILVGMLLAALLAIQCTTAPAWNKGHDVVVIDGKQSGSNVGQADKLEQLAKTDHIALLQMCLDNYQAKYHDYTCTFTKQEVINGTNKPLQMMEVKHMAQPFSVAMHWIKNPPLGDTVLYVEGQYNDQMLVRPTSPLLRGLVGTVVRSPDDAEAMKNTLRPVNMFGFERGLKSLLEIYKKAKDAGDLKQSFGGYAEVGDPKGGGRKCMLLVRNLPDKPEYKAASPKTVIYIDADYLLPVRIEGFDASGTPDSSYDYGNIKFNVGLAAKDFRPESNEMQPPK